MFYYFRADHKSISPLTFSVGSRISKSIVGGIEQKKRKKFLVFTHLSKFWGGVQSRSNDLKVNEGVVSSCCPLCIWKGGCCLPSPKSANADSVMSWAIYCACILRQDWIDSTIGLDSREIERETRPGIKMFIMNTSAASLTLGYM